jgi:preprotein translocase subunit YajC
MEWVYSLPFEFAGATMKIVHLLVMLLISPFAFAADAAAQEPSAMGPMVFIGAMLVLMYFLVWRPQQKKVKQHASVVSAVKVGDEVLMNSGIVGKIMSVFDTHFEVDISEGVKVLVQKNMISAPLPKGSMKSIKGKSA